ncbi:hypothetical protein A5727_21745 [Mycobacterium sp. ACS4331]|nr:hypothetical protein A5727_21745 [Mycobacterium sp. ACS4331]
MTVGTGWIRWVSLVLLATVALVGCGGGSTGEISRGPAPVPEDAAMAPAPVSGPQPQEPAVKRDVVKTASMVLTVPDTSAAADQAAVIAEDSGGRVDSRTEDAGSGSGRASSSVVLRIPADRLDEVLRRLKELGVVESTETRADDVTAQRVDLDARIRALQTSVDRLLAIMRDAADPEALIAAENALSQRQAELDSLRAQRTQLGEQVDYSTVNVNFIAEQIGGPAPQRYSGFLGEVHRGWDALVGLVKDLVLLLGWWLPWLGALVVAAALVYGVVVVLRQALRRMPRLSSSSRSDSDNPPQIP